MKEQPITSQSDNGLGIASMVLGTISLSGFGFLLGIPAIVLAIIALKKKAGNRGLSIAGLVTGIVSTVLSLLFLAFVILMIIISANEPTDTDTDRNIDPGYERGINSDHI